MKKTLFLIMMLCCHIVAVAQMSRRAIEKYSTEAVKQIALTGRTPTIDILDSLANNADVSIEMLSRMGDADDVRQQHACLKLIDDIVAYSLKPTGMKYVDVVRQGLKKAIDRSYEPDVQQHVLEQLALVAKPNDVAHVAMYLEIDQLAPTVAQMLVAMPDIDDRLAEAAKTNLAVKEKLLAVISARRGKAASATCADHGEQLTSRKGGFGVVYDCRHSARAETEAYGSAALDGESAPRGGEHSPSAVARSRQSYHHGQRT